MERKDFLKCLCLGGICSCAVVPVLADEKPHNSEKDKELASLKQNAAFVQHRMAKLVDILDRELDDASFNKIIRALGQECSRQYANHLQPYRNNPDGFLAFARKNWEMNGVHDARKRQITVIGKDTGKCPCPFVDSRLMSNNFCDCSLGWMTNTFSFIVGKPVKARVVESVLRGSRRCTYTVSY